MRKIIILIQVWKFLLQYLLMGHERISILTAGSFGTALAFPAAQNGHDVLLYNRKEEDTETFRRTGEQRRLPGFVLPKNVEATSNLHEAVNEADLLILATPSRSTASFFKEMREIESGAAPILSVVKGLDGHMLISQALEGIDPSVGKRLAVLSGPNFSTDIAGNIPVETVIASENESGDIFAGVFNTKNFRVYQSTDIIGVQLGGALKNVIAIAAGTCNGMGVDNSSRVSIVSHGLSEMSDLGVAMGAKRETFLGPSGKGDLELTCSLLSRNYQTGIALGQGADPQELLKSDQTVEGLYTVKTALELAKKHSLKLPIMEAVGKLVYGGIGPHEAVKQFMATF